MQLHDYQQYAVEHLHRNARGALFLDMGLGKTAVVLSALREEHLPVLVSAPARVASEVWPIEKEIWRPDLSLSLAYGPPADRAAALRTDADIVVISQESLADALPSTISERFKTIVLDEMSAYKSPKSRRYRAARHLVAAYDRQRRVKHWKVDHVWGLTGTPSPNGLMDLWAQLQLLDGGERLGRTIGGFRMRYFTPGHRLPGGHIAGYNIKPTADEKIHEKIEDICLSMTSEGRIELPPVTFNKVSVPLPTKVERVYKTMKDNLVADMSLIGISGTYSAANAAILSNRLSQISAGFMYEDDPFLEGNRKTAILHTAKIDAVKEIVAGTGSPVLVLYQYRAEAEMLRQSLKGLVHSIDEKDSVKRWNRAEIPVLLAHPASIGHGLNLQHGGHTAVWASLPWSLEQWEQTNKRLARQGQENPVVIHMLMSPGTVDVAKRRRLIDKISVQDALMEHLESPL